MTREDIKLGPIYIELSELPWIALNYRTKERRQGRAFNLLNKNIKNTFSFYETIERALDLLIDDLDKTIGLQNILSIENIEHSSLRKLLIGRETQ